MANKAKSEDITELRKKFDEVTYSSFTEYAKRKNITESRLKAVLSNKVKVFTYEIMKVYYKLKEDGIYELDVYPWEDGYENLKEFQESA